MSAERNLAARSPIAQYTSLIALSIVAAIVWAAPTLAAKVWSRTGWNPGGKLTDLVNAYRHLMHPEEVPASGMHGRAFAYTTITILAVAIAGSIIAAFSSRGELRPCTCHHYPNRADVASNLRRESLPEPKPTASAAIQALRLRAEGTTQTARTSGGTGDARACPSQSRQRAQRAMKLSRRSRLPGRHERWRGQGVRRG